MNKLNNLSQIQLLLQTAVQQHTNSNELLNLLTEKPPIGVTERLNIYQEAYEIRLFESLRDDFISVESVLDPDKFEAFAMGFIRANPSKFKNLAEYSEGFAEYIYKVYPELGVTAYTDWLEILSAHTENPADELPLDQIQIGTEFNLQARPSTNSKKIGDTYIVTYKCQDEVENLKITEPQFRLLQFLQTQKSMTELTHYAESNLLSTEDLSANLHAWIKNQIIYCKKLTLEPSL